MVAQAVVFTVLILVSFLAVLRTANSDDAFNLSYMSFILACIVMLMVVGENQEMNTYIDNLEAQVEQCEVVDG